MNTRKRRSSRVRPRAVRGPDPAGQVGDPLLRAQQSAGAKNALDFGDFGARRQAVRGERVS